MTPRRLAGRSTAAAVTERCSRIRPLVTRQGPAHRTCLPAMLEPRFPIKVDKAAL